jgi:hypothetical protein
MRLRERVNVSVALLLLAGGMIVLNDLDPDGCMVQLKRLTPELKRCRQWER